MSKNLTLRIIVAIIGIPALIYICLTGGYFLLGFTILLVGIGGYELHGMLRRRNYNVRLYLAIALPTVFIVAAFYDISLFDMAMALFLFHTCLITIDYTRLGNYDLSLFLSEMFARILPVLYLGLLGSYIMEVGKIPVYGGRLLIYAFMITWATDTFAYFGGKNFGRHKFSPTLSPNKTWEGFYSGIFGAIAAGLIARFVLLDLSWSILLLMAIVGSAAGQIGDLFESAIKRHCGVKDSSSILPGHGGILDRFDSYLFAVPVIYLIYTYW